MARISLLTNVPSLGAQRRFASATSDLRDVYSRLSSGLRIVKASDDAAGLAISEGLNTDARVFNAGVRNINDGTSLLSISEEALKGLSTITIRQIELSEQAANGVYSTKQRRALDAEANALVREFNRIVQSTDFNGRELLEASDELRIQAGYGLDGSISFAMNDAFERSVGDGTFTADISFFSIDWTKDAELIDLNNDGKLDLIAGGQPSSGNNRVIVKIGNGNGTFNYGTEYSYAINQDYMEVADLNGDGLTDLITAGGGINVRLATSAGVFGSVTSYSMVESDLTVGDVNGDSIMDLVTVGGNDYLAVRLGIGDGTFGASRSYSFTNDHSAHNVSLGDINNDGMLDVVSTGVVGNNSEIYIRLNDGTGTFSNTTIVTAGGSNIAWGESTLADMNLDGNLDMIACGYSTASGLGVVSIYAGLGNGQFKSNPVTLTNSVPTTTFYDVAVSDVNGDGIRDLTLGGVGNGSSIISTVLAVNENLQYGGFVNNLDTGVRYEKVCVGDLNSDGAVDFVALGLLGNSRSILGNVQKTTRMAYLDLTTQTSARSTLSTLREQLTRINSELGNIGALQSRCQVALTNLQVQKENFLESGSRIKDADIAQEASTLVRKNILQSTSAQIIATANLQTELALRLISG